MGAVSQSHWESQEASPEVQKGSEVLTVALSDQRRLREKTAEASSELFEERTAFGLALSKARLRRGLVRTEAQALLQMRPDQSQSRRRSPAAAR